MGEAGSPSYRVGVVWRGDRKARATAEGSSSRLSAVFDALASRGIAAEPAVYFEEAADEVRAQLHGMDGVLVWVDPISGGRRRDGLNALLREVAAAGVLVSAHPDVIDKMGVKEVLYLTRDLGWGADTHLYVSPEALATAFAWRLANRVRVLKQNRGNGGIGVWRVEAVGDEEIQVQEATRDAPSRRMALAQFLAERAGDFEDGGRLIDQAFQARLPEGMIRCYMSGDQVVGFGRQIIHGLLPVGHGPPGPRLMSGPDHPPFQALRARMEGDWTPAMARRLGIAPDDLPVIWDADFLYGPKTAGGEDTHVLCEINVSSVFPIPDQAPDALALTLASRLAARREASPSRNQPRKPR